MRTADLVGRVIALQCVGARPFESHRCLVVDAQPDQGGIWVEADDRPSRSVFVGFAGIQSMALCDEQDIWYCDALRARHPQIAGTIREEITG